MATLHAPPAASLQRYRRPRVDDEASLDTSRAVAMLAALFMTGMRLERILMA